ncbi:hypothetical protein [Serratia grimesii]|uniref:hypothetical protein n=1 Tax=Serratia grimesii TaxID=82995 RepID=UPI0021CA8AA7|nr:hypothetical protein [Serratia grimesii]
MFIDSLLQFFSFSFSNIGLVLPLVGLVTNNHATSRHRRLRGAFWMHFIACAGKGSARQIGQHIGPTG